MPREGSGDVCLPQRIPRSRAESWTYLMIAAQALERRTVEQRKEMDALRAKNADLKARLELLSA